MFIHDRDGLIELARRRSDANHGAAAAYSFGIMAAIFGIVLAAEEPMEEAGDSAFVLAGLSRTAGSARHEVGFDFDIFAGDARIGKLSRNVLGRAVIVENCRLSCY